MNAFYDVHEEMRSQTGLSMSMVWGLIHINSLKQKLNNKISKKSELLGTSEYLTYNIWLLMLLLDQVYSIVNNTISQNNQSAIKIEINGRK